MIMGIQMLKNVNQHWEVEELVSAIDESLEGGAVCCLHTGIEEYSDTQSNFSFQHSLSKLNSLMQGYNPLGLLAVYNRSKIIKMKRI